MSGDVQEIVKVLSDHAWIADHHGISCRCGDGLTPIHSSRAPTIEDHVAHVSSIVATHVRDAVAAGKAEALAPVLALAEDYQHRSEGDAWMWMPIYREVYRAVAFALRAAAGTPTHHTTEEDADE